MIDADKPFSQACENNKRPILAVLRRHLVDQPAAGSEQRLLEIGSGTGQHAAFFAQQLPQLRWQPSDLIDNHPGIEAWRASADLHNLLPPLALNVSHSPWPLEEPVDAVFSANTAHIMAWQSVVDMLVTLPSVLTLGGLFFLYGPFNYGGDYSSPSNRDFDAWLKARAPHQGIRHSEEVIELAARAGLTLVEDNAMPANNRLLVFRLRAQ